MRKLIYILTLVCLWGGALAQNEHRPVTSADARQLEPELRRVWDWLGKWEVRSSLPKNRDGREGQHFLYAHGTALRAYFHQNGKWNYVAIDSTAGGDITAVLAGWGLNGGGYSGAVTLTADSTELATAFDVQTVLDSLSAFELALLDSLGSIEDSLTVIMDSLATFANGDSLVVNVLAFGAVGDSTTDNAAAIRAALKYAHNKGGGIVWFPGGEEAIYGIKDTLHVYSNLRLMSNGAWVKRLASSTHIQMFQMNDVDNISFDHFNIDGNGLQENVIIGGCDNFKVVHCRIKNAGAWSVRSISDTNVVISHNHFWNCNTPIGIWSGYNVRVENNTIDNRLYDAAWGGVESGITMVGLIDGFITGNTWYRAADSVAATACESIYLADGGAPSVSNVVIADNKIYCYAGNQFGISLSALTGNITDVIIKGNYVEGSRTIGAIELGGVERCVVDHNIIKNTHAGPDISLNGACTDLTISNTEIINGPDTGISGAGVVTNLIIDHCTIRSIPGWAVALSNVTNGKLVNCIIDSCYGVGMTGDGNSYIGNTITNTQASTSGVFGVGSSRNTLIEGNVVTNGGGYATVFAGNVWDLAIKGNFFTRCQGVLRNSGSTVKRVDISGNTIIDPITEAVAQVYGSYIHDLVLSDNRLFGGFGGFVDLASAAGDTVRSFVCKNNTIILDSTTADRANWIIGLNNIKNAEIADNFIQVRHGIQALSWVPFIAINGNSDSCVVKNNTIRGDSASVWETTALYLANAGADHCLIKDNIISGFLKGIDVDNVRTTNVVKDNEVTNCTTAYEIAGGALGILSEYLDAGYNKATVIWNPTLARLDTVYALQSTIGSALGSIAVQDSDTVNITGGTIGGATTVEPYLFKLPTNISGYESGKLYWGTSGSDHYLIIADGSGYLFFMDYLKFIMRAGSYGGQTIIGGLDDGEDLKFMTTADSANAGHFVFDSTGTGMPYFEEDTLRVAEYMWDDVTVSAMQLAPGSNSPSLRAFKGGIYGYAYNPAVANDIQYGQAQIPHGYDEGSDIEPHLHIALEDAPAAGDTVVFAFEYTWTNIDTLYPVSDTLTVKAPVSSWSALQHHLVDLGSLSGKGKKISSVVHFRIERMQNSSSDTYDDWVFLSDIDFHVRKDSYGSRQETVK